MIAAWRLALAALLLAGPAAPVVAQPAEADDLVQFIHVAGPLTARARTGGEVPAEKAIAITRRDGQLIVTTMYALWSHEWEDPPEGTIAVMRTRARSSSGGPEPADLDYAQRTGVRLFIVGEWADPPPIWELERHSDGMRIRDIDAEGRPGAWRTGTE